jgi:integrase
LAALVEAWLSSAPGLRDTTRATYREFMTRYAFPAFEREPLSRITPDRLQVLYAGLKPSVAEKLHRILHRAFAVAVMWRWLAENPCDRVLRPDYRPARRVMWNEAQAQAFVAGIEGHWLAPLYVLLLATGLRLGEALALTWDDVGLGVAVSVAGTLQRLDGAPTVNEPKTAAGRRTVLLPAPAIEALKVQRAQQDAWREAAGANWQPSVFVFTGETGKPLNRCVPEAALKRLCARLELPPMTPHGLRHLHGSLLIAQAIPLTAVSARLGHANPQITLRLYSHALPGQDQLAADAIGRAMQPVEAKRK